MDDAILTTSSAGSPVLKIRCLTIASIGVTEEENEVFSRFIEIPSTTSMSIDDVWTTVPADIPEHNEASETISILSAPLHL